MTDERTPGEVLFVFLVGHTRWLCELRDRGAYGIEAQFFRNEDFHHSRHFETKAAAVAWAEFERKAIEKGGA